MLNLNGKSIQLQNLNFIGRNENQSVTIKHDSISKSHAKIEKKNQFFVVVDLKSTNGTYLNGKLIQPLIESELTNGDILRFGKDKQNYIYQQKQNDFSFNQQEEQVIQNVQISQVDVSSAQSRLFQNQLRTVQLQNDELQKEISELSIQNEKLLVQQNQMNKQLHQYQKESEIISQENQNIQLENQKLHAKVKALELYCSDIQNKYEKQSIIEESQKNIIKEYERVVQNQDYQTQKDELTLLRQLLEEKTSQISDLLNQNKEILYNEQNNLYHQIVYEQQVREIQNLKQQIKQYENQQNECKYKWNALLQENIDKDQQILNLNLYIEKQTQQLNEKIYNYDKKMNQYNKQIIKIQNVDQQQKDAANFLIKQIDELSDENYIYQQEIENQKLKINESQQEIEKYQKQLKEQKLLLDEKVVFLKMKLEETQDSLYQNIQTNGILKNNELKNIIETLENKIKLQEDQIQQWFIYHILSEKYVQEKKDNKNLIDFYTQVIMDKDLIINSLSINKQKNSQFYQKQTQDFQNEKVDEIFN